MPDRNPIDALMVNGAPNPPGREVRKPRTPDTHIDLHSRLRRSTRAIHERVERQMDLERVSTSIEAYSCILEDMLRLHRPIERTLSALVMETAGIDFEARRKVGWLIADLIDLGHDAAALQQLRDFAPVPAPATPDEALGVLYVLEGSSLGGQVILGRLGPALGVGPLWAGRFFNGYGQATGAMWRTFIARLNVLGADPHTAAVIEASAISTFAAFESCLAKAEASIAIKSPIHGTLKSGWSS